MTNILTMVPAGEVYNHDNVRWYEHGQLQYTLGHYHNIGDAFVYDSSLKLLNYEVLEVLDLEAITVAGIDRINDEFDYVFLRGSNYLHNEMQWWRALEILPRLRIPIIAFGIGAQAPVHGRLQLSPESERVMKLIADNCVSMGVRGAFTQDVLWNIGIKNTRIVGCPTAFRRNDPDLRIKLPKLSDVQNVGITVRREVSEQYAEDVYFYLNSHRDLIKEMSGRFDISLLMQGEVEEKALLWGSTAERSQAWDDLNSNEWMATNFFDEKIRALWAKNLFYSDDVSEFEAKVTAQDLVLGYRLHGNLLALANGVPAVFFTYDSRTTEFAETFAIPSHAVFSQRPFHLEDFWDQSLFDRYNRAWLATYQSMSGFLDENGVDHKMRPTALDRGMGNSLSA